ncbi:MAG TPA: hypothetical protein VE127_09170 [Solirubrobacteraceae bacterium]|nr:hypothetical protein [Solirubrobacteraceae bacterium]
MSPLRLPLWARWGLSLGVGLIAAIALIVFVEHNNSSSEATQNPAAVARANRVASIVVAQDQAPHVAQVRPGSSPRAAIVRAIHDDMTQLINRGILDGPLRRTACRQTGAHSGRLAFSCHAFAADFKYPFLGVVDVAARRVTYCKRDVPPVPSMNVPVSPRCRA